MKKLLMIGGLLLGTSLSGYSQKLISGDYGEVQLAYDANKNLVTGYYSSGTGWDENSSRFFCEFYFRGKI